MVYLRNSVLRRLSICSVVCCCVQNLTCSMVEGISGGMMMALVSATMLPEAFERGGDISGLFCVLGFLSSVCIRALFGYIDTAEFRQKHKEAHAHAAALAAKSNTTSTTTFGVDAFGDPWAKVAAAGVYNLVKLWQ